MSAPGQPPVESRLRRDISRLGFSAINLNAVIGAGIFGLPAVAAARAGDFSPWMFLVCAALIFTVVLSFARAASMVRTTGGVIVYAHAAFGPFVGFQTGWLAFVARAVAMGANTNLLVTYAAWFWNPLDADPWRSLALTVLIGGLTWLNMTGVRHSVAVIYTFTVMKLAPLSLLILLGLGQVDAQTLFGAQWPQWGEFGDTILVLLYAFVGFEGTPVTAGEGREPRRDVPRALIDTIVLITAIYFLVQWVSMAVLPDLASSGTALADVAGVLMGPAGAAVLTLGAVFSIGGNLSSSMLSAPRMLFALGRDGSLPDWFAGVHEQYRTPNNAIGFYGLLCLVLAITGSFVWLAAMSTLVRLVTYIICIAALPRLARQSADPEYEFRLPGGLLIPAIALVLSLWLVTHASALSWGLTLAFAAIGSALYFLARRTAAP